MIHCLENKPHKQYAGCLSCGMEALEKDLALAKAALETICSDKHNIGNDWNGNLKGYPDAVMCRAIASRTLSQLEKKGAGTK